MPRSSPSPGMTRHSHTNAYQTQSRRASSNLQTSVLKLHSRHPQTTSALVPSLIAAQATGPLRAPIALTVNTLEPSSNTLTNENPVLRVRLTLPHRALRLQWLKYQFVAARQNAVTLGSTEKEKVEWGEEDVARAFAEFLEN